MDRAKVFVSPAVPPRFIHWKTLLLFSIVIWILSFLAFDGGQEFLAAAGWILITISIGWATSLPPFIIGKIPLSPWVIATFICLLLYPITDDETNLIGALKAWPIIAAIFIAVLEWFKTRNPEKLPPLLSRNTLTIIILIHLLISCWIEIYFLVAQQIENNPELNPNTTRPRSAFQQSPSNYIQAKNYQFIKPDEQFPEIF